MPCGSYLHHDFLVCVVLAGGLATGADEVKSDKQRMIFGGLANTILDPCYHQVSYYHFDMCKQKGVSLLVCFIFL